MCSSSSSFSGTVKITTIVIVIIIILYTYYYIEIPFGEVTILLLPLALLIVKTLDWLFRKSNIEGHGGSVARAVFLLICFSMNNSIILF